MSLVLAYHCPQFGAVMSDSRVSRLMPDGSRVAVDGVRKKLAVLRHGLVLAGSSPFAVLDHKIFALLESLVRSRPEASFDEVAAMVPVAVALAESSLEIRGERKISLMLLGHDLAGRRVRNVAFSFTDGACERSEYESGALASGFIEPEERLGRVLLDRMLGQRTQAAVIGAMSALAEEIAASRPNVVGAPYFAELVRAEAA